MTGAVHQLAGVPAFVCADAGPRLNGERDATDLLGEVFGAGARVVVLPVSRLGPDFLQLKTRVAGDVLQKFITYGFRVAIVGDVSAAAAASAALRDFIRESNRGVMVRFAEDLAELERAMPPAWAVL